ncbi:MAG TPA: right-handed parallel beta-helix repeat-containing protein, partial [Marmoricola sp.]
MTILLVGGVFAAAPASAHIERPSYWPLPGADCHVHPCAGGKVPKVRTLASALHHHKFTRVRVVCHKDSMHRLRVAIKKARKHGYNIRPHDHRKLTKKRAKQLLRINKALKKKCGYRQIQPAVTASNNNDRVIVMPGLYTEPTSSHMPTNDPKCAKYKITDNKDGDILGAVTYPYQFHCPNDQNLIAVIGRALGPGKDPHPPKVDRHGIPNAGKCIRCNLQLEGSGVSADDVIVDAGRVKSGNGYPLGSRKDVGIRADRADGFVLRNLTVRHAREHDIYVIEADGYRLTHFKTYAGGEYGVLTFVGDHGLIDNCDSAGSGDSSLYPGAGAKTNVGRDKKFYPKARYSQRITHCDAHHSLAGYSGTDGSSTHIDHNNFYNNALGFTTDVFTAAGHPGFPQSGDLIDHNNFYSNNFNPYVKGSPIHPAQPEPVGTGLWIAGGNSNVIRDNHFYDNWRRGTMLFSVPNALICGPTAS